MPKNPAWTRAVGVSAAVVWAAGVLVRASTPQTPELPAPKPASAGVYTAAQAGRGREVFGNICQGCHNIGSQSGDAFAKRWRGALVSDMFKVITDTMPKDTPGSLTLQERADVIAYLLKINDIAAGADELPTDIEQLKKIVIDLPGGSPWGERSR